jgi:polar amino acid transport system substrate-binding protein
MKKSLLLLGTVCLAMAPSFASALTLTAVYEDQENAPDYMGDGTVVPATNPGYAVEALRMAAADLGHTIEFKRLPWKRCLSSMESGSADILFTASYKKKREALGAYPKTAAGELDESRRLTTASYSLYRKVGSSANFDGTSFSNVKTVAAPLGYSIVDNLKEKGLEVTEVSKIPGMFKQLAAGRVDAVAMLTVSDSYLSDLGIAGIERVETPIVSKPYYAMISNQFVAKEKAVAEAIWTKLQEIRDTKRETILSKY